MAKTCKTLLAGLAAVVLLVTGAVGGSAVAKGKITGKQIARNAIAAKHLRSGSVTGDKIAAGAVTGAKLAPDTVTGAQVDEATLGRVPDAAAVAGQAVTPLSLRLLSTNGAPVVIATGPDWTLGLDCSSTNALVSLEKTGTASLVSTTVLVSGTAPQLTQSAFALSQLAGDIETFDYDLTSLVAGTATVVVELTGVRSPNTFGATDCFFHGTVTTTG